MLSSSLLLPVLITLCSLSQHTVHSWEGHDISTLKLLQVVHRHGDRNAENWFPNDPFLNLTQYWPEGEGELTNHGKYRMYKVGQYIRQHYGQYLGAHYSPREVYVRSSAKGRCLESAQQVLAGAYPPNNTEWQWGSQGVDAELGNLWQPIPIDTYIPMDDDKVLRVEAYCPAVNEELQRIYRSDRVVSALAREQAFLDELSGYVGYKFETIERVSDFYDTLSIEASRGYMWSAHKVWTPAFQQSVLDRLRPLVELYWLVKWDSSLVHRVRAGPLVEQLVRTFRDYRPDSGRRIFLWSTHDSKLDVVMQALDVFNGLLVPYGSVLFFELHRDVSPSSNYFVRLYYYNETLDETKSPYLLRVPKCGGMADCPIDRFYELTQGLIPGEWDVECGLSSGTYGTFTLVNISLLAVNVVLSIALISLFIYISRKRKASYESLD